MYRRKKQTEGNNSQSRRVKANICVYSVTGVYIGSVLPLLCFKTQTNQIDAAGGDRRKGSDGLGTRWNSVVLLAYSGDCFPVTTPMKICPGAYLCCFQSVSRFLFLFWFVRDDCDERQQVYIMAADVYGSGSM